MDDIAFEADIESPAKILLSAGSDPTLLVEEAAKRVKKNVNTVSIGQVREEFAEAYLHNPKLQENESYFRIVI
jgi:hypothetical protein